MKLYPSMPFTPQNEDFYLKVKHELQLRVKPIGGKEAWNTLEIRLRRTKLSGSKRGTLKAVTLKPVPLGFCIKFVMVVALLVVPLLGACACAYVYDAEGTLATLASYNVPFSDELHTMYLNDKDAGNGKQEVLVPLGPRSSCKAPPPPPPPTLSREEAYERLKAIPYFDMTGMDDEPEKLKLWIDRLVEEPNMLEALEIEAFAAPDPDHPRFK